MKLQILEEIRTRPMKWRWVKDLSALTDDLGSFQPIWEEERADSQRLSPDFLVFTIHTYVHTHTVNKHT